LSGLSGKLSSIRVVLVEPRYDGNLGQIARAMLNFGLSRMWIAGGQADPKSQEARWYARAEGAPVLDAAVRVETFDQAIHGCELVIGTSRRLGKGRGPAALPGPLFRELAPWRRPGETALVFGREAHGLYTHETDRCHRVVAIPSDPECPSLNVSHAVAVIGYALSLEAHADLGERLPAEKEPERAAGADELEAMYRHMREVWQRIGYLQEQNPDAVLRRWRRIFGRTELASWEVAIVRGLLHQTDWIASLAGIPVEGLAAVDPALLNKHRPRETVPAGRGAARPRRGDRPAESASPPAPAGEQSTPGAKPGEDGEG